MQISMEVLSQLIPRTDSGASVPQKAQSFSSPELTFSKIFDDRRTIMVNPVISDDRMRGKINKAGEPALEVPQDPDKDDKYGACLAAGVTGNQNMVVFILEGDKESAAIPEINVDAYMIPDDIVPAAAGTDTNTITPGQLAADADTEPQAISTTNIATEVNAAEAGKELSRTVRKEDKTGVDAAKATAGSDEGAAGEVTARTPVLRTSELQETGNNENSGTGNSDSGDLSPLENKNDEAPVKTKKDKTYSETAETVRSKAADDQQITVKAAIPLVEGIKPERFQADQQMNRASLSAPVRKDDLFDEMISRIEMMQTDSTKSMAIQLKPEFLGKVALEIAMDAAGLHVKINAEDNSVRSMISTQMNALIESLENKGIAVVEVEVTYTGVNNGAFKDSREDQAQQGRSRRLQREIDSVDSAEFYAAFPLGTLEYYLDEDVSSVEYRA